MSLVPFYKKQNRADLFIEAWTGRVEEMGVKSVVIFAHAASVIALGRAVSNKLCFLSSMNKSARSCSSLSVSPRLEGNRVEV
jgi:hypothetical protein